MPDTRFTRGEMPETVTRHGRLAAAAVIAWLCLTGPGAANEPGIYIPAWNTQCAIGKDIAQGCEAVRARTIVNAARYPWAAVGRINFAGYRTRQHCTGALVGERLVLTAAHCLYDRRDRKWLKPQSINFLAGYQRGTHVAHARAAGYIVSKTHKTGSRAARIQSKTGLGADRASGTDRCTYRLSRMVRTRWRRPEARPARRREDRSRRLSGTAQGGPLGRHEVWRGTGRKEWARADPPVLGDAGRLRRPPPAPGGRQGNYCRGPQRRRCPYSGKVVPVSPGVAGFYQTILRALGRGRADNIQ